MRFHKMLLGKPKLHHYTTENSIVNVLQSQSLWASPTWDFKDSEEYVLGLRLVKEVLLRFRADRDPINVLSETTRTLLGRYDIDPKHFLELVIDLVEYDIANRADPRIKVYVACVCAEPYLPHMTKEYGDYIVTFNDLIHLLGYSYPWPFKGAMLSKVRYDNAEFTRWVETEGLKFVDSPKELERVACRMSRLSATERETAVADSAAAYLCAFAPNIKGERYAIEKEWRFKSVLIEESMTVLFGDDDPGAMTKHFCQPDGASFTAFPPKNRYIQNLAMHGRMIIENIAVPVQSTHPSTRQQEILESVDALKHAGKFMGPGTKIIEEFLKFDLLE